MVLGRGTTAGKDTALAEDVITEVPVVDAAAAAAAAALADCNAMSYASLAVSTGVSITGNIAAGINATASDSSVTIPPLSLHACFVALSLFPS